VYFVYFFPPLFFHKKANHSYLCKNTISGSLMPSCSALDDIAWKTSTICMVDQAFLACWGTLVMCCAGGHGLVLCPLRTYYLTSSAGTLKMNKNGVKFVLLVILRVIGRWLWLWLATQKMAIQKLATACLQSEKRHRLHVNCPV